MRFSSFAKCARYGKEGFGMAMENNKNTIPITKIEETQLAVHGMVMESYQDMLAGKGRGYKEVFNELEKKYLTLF